jgi:hypothetical protein
LFALPLESRAVSLPDASIEARPCRPTISCTADIVAPGVVEVEMGYLFQRLAPATWQHAGTLLVKWSLARWLQVQVGASGGLLDSDAGTSRYVDSLTVVAKLHLLDQDERTPSLSLTTTVGFPVAHGAISSSSTDDAIFTLYASKDVRWLHIDINAGVYVHALDATPLAHGFAALAFSATIPHTPLTPTIEGYAFGDAGPYAPADAGIRLAMYWQARSWMVIDLGGDAGLIPSTRSFSLFAGLTIIPVVLWRG